MTHDGHSAARVSGACFAMGQAAGTAAALALQAGCSVHELPVEPAAATARRGWRVPGLKARTTASGRT
jgi:hypothetical protein